MVLYGRDLDRDGKIDAWFYPDDSGTIQAIDRQSANTGDGWDVASQIILKNRNSYEDRGLVGLVVHATLSKLTFSSSSEDDLQREIVGQELDLRDLEIRTARLSKQWPEDREHLETLLQMRETISAGWNELIQEMHTDVTRNRFLYGSADVALGLASAGTAKILGKGVEWALPRAAAAAPAWAVSAYNATVDSMSEAWSRAGRAVGWPVVAGAAQILRETAAQRISLLVRGLNSREQIASIFARSIDVLGKVAKGALRQWKYIASTQALELGVEIYERRDQLFSANPVVFAKRVFTDKDLLEDVGFMTWDSTLATGISQADPNVKRRMVICGVISLMNSEGASFLVKKEPDKIRTGIDTSWEMVVGNIETQVDLKALSTFEALSEKSGNPRLKLLGYAAAFVDDGLGYWAYEKVTSRYESVKAQDAAAGKTVGMFEWIPLFGER
jgi:hypothetical protein